MKPFVNLRNSYASKTEVEKDATMRRFVYIGGSIVILGTVIIVTYMVYYFNDVVPGRRQDYLNRFQEIVCSNPESYANSIVNEYHCSSFQPHHRDEIPPPYPSQSKSSLNSSSSNSQSSRQSLPQSTPVQSAASTATRTSITTQTVSAPSQPAATRSGSRTAPGSTKTATSTAPASVTSTTCVLTLLGARVCVPT